MVLHILKGQAQIQGSANTSSGWGEARDGVQIMDQRGEQTRRGFAGAEAGRKGRRAEDLG